MWTLIVVLLLLWALGLFSAHTFGGLLHILILIAVVLLIYRLLSGRNAL